MSRGGGGDAKKKRGAEGQVLLGNRLMVRKEPRCQQWTSPPAQEGPLTRGVALQACSKRPRPGCAGSTKDVSKGWGSCFVTIPPSGPAQCPAGRSQLPKGDVAGKEPVVQVFKAKVRKGLTQPFPDLELF